MGRPSVGLAVIVRREGKVLVGLRYGAHGADTWSFPGGHLEGFESLEACGRREVDEETGLAIENLAFAGLTNDLFREEAKHYITIFLVADWANGEPVVREPDKCREWRWVAWEDLPKPHFLPIDNLLRQGFHPFQSDIRSLKDFT
jgi:8-oxo-dGTP diphosphatase